MRRYVLYGAGAVGATIGACLFEAGHQVVLIARGENGRLLADNGLRFGTAAGWRTLRIPVVEHPSKLTFGDDDVVMLSMKSQDTQPALDALFDCAPPDIPVVCAQNGVENERRALRLFPNVHGMLLMMAAVSTEPGVVHAHNVPFSGICDLGRYLGGVDAIDESVAADLEASSLRSIARPDIMSRKYAKLVFNLVNVVEAASGRGAGDALLQRARAEALACLERSGIVPFTGTDSRVEEMRVAAVEGVERGAGSTWQSLARGAQTLEVDDLNGEISLLGRLHGIPTPANAYLQRLARRLVRERIAPGGLDARELEEDGLASTTT